MFGKGQNPQQTHWQTAQHPALSYLPDGWEFAIVTVKPPKGCNNTENGAVRQFSAAGAPRGQRPGAGFPCAGFQPQNRSLCLTLPLPASPGL